VHYEDLGEAFSLVAEASINVVEAQIYHVADESRYSFEEVVVKMGRAAGATCEVEYKDAKEDAFHNFLDVDCLVSSNKIRSHLQWFPRHAPFLESVDVYFQSYASFKSSNNNH
jgi:UDP-glucose 4-epimerase